MRRRRETCKAAGPATPVSLLEEYDIGLSDLAFAHRLRTDPGLARAVVDWLEAEAERPHDLPAADWLRWEQAKHERLLAAAALTATP